jgi:hypothetical protein
MERNKKNIKKICGDFNLAKVLAVFCLNDANRPFGPFKAG